MNCSTCWTWFRAHAWMLAALGLALLLIVSLLSGRGYRMRGMQTMSAGMTESVADRNLMMNSASKEMMQGAIYDEGMMYDSLGQADRSVIRSASMTLRVQDVTASLLEIESIVESVQGVISFSNEHNDNDGRQWGNLTLRIPADQLDATMTRLRDLAEQVEQVYSGSDDVTEVLADLNARLENKRAEEVQYREILARATAIQDVLTATQYLSNVRYEIESMEAQLKSLGEQVKYSTLEVSLTEDVEVASLSESWKPFRTLQGAFLDWVRVLQTAVDGVIYLVVFAGPLAVLAALVWFYKKRR